MGDPRAMPVAAWTYQPGVGYAITDDGPLSLDERYSGTPSAVEQDVADAVRQMAGGFTLRGGRLLAQYGIRFVVVPLADGVNGTISNPLPAPAGLADVLDDQLDLASPLTRPPNFLVYENTAYTPTRAVLTPVGAQASKQAGGEAVAQADLRGSTPWAIGAPDRGDAVDALPAGTLHVAVPFDEGWHLAVDGARCPGSAGLRIHARVRRADRRHRHAHLRHRLPASDVGARCSSSMLVALLLAAQPRALVEPRAAPPSSRCSTTRPRWSTSRRRSPPPVLTDRRRPGRVALHRATRSDDREPPPSRPPALRAGAAGAAGDCIPLGVAKTRPPAATPTFAALGEPTMPFVPTGVVHQLHLVLRWGAERGRAPPAVRSPWPTRPTPR